MTQEQKQRRSIRLQGYDYSSAGAYFVTICAHDHETPFGQITNDEMILSKAGRIVLACWQELPTHYGHVELDAFVVMPNHVHSIIVLGDDDWRDRETEASRKPASTKGRQPLSEVVRAFKTFSAKKINELSGVTGIPVWQRNYYEHIIRNDRELQAIRQYILDNPAKWALDRENPQR